MHFSIKIYMVCSYSFELSKKTALTTFILNYHLICLLMVKLWICFVCLFTVMYFSIKIYMVCSYSFELSQKTVPTTFILNYHLICPYLEAIEKVRFFFYLMHFSIKIYMECRYSFKLSQKTVHCTYNIYSKLLPHMSAFLEL